MTEEQELDRRIEEKLREIRLDDRRIDRVRKVVQNRDASADHLVSVIQDLGDFSRHQHRVLKDLRDGVRGGHTGDEPGAEIWDDERLTDKREEIADEIDHCKARRERVVLRLDQVAKTERRARRALDRLMHEKEDDREAIERMRERRQHMEDNQEGQLSKDFHVEEFNCHNGTRIVTFCPYIIPYLEKQCNEHLQPLRDSGGPVGITSALRPEAYNRSIGGAPLSYHVYENRKEDPAVDHTQVGRPASEVQQWHESHNPYDGMGFYSGFTHGDDRGYHSRWTGAS
jgi:hypothetical protein